MRLRPPMRPMIMTPMVDLERRRKELSMVGNSVRRVDQAPLYGRPLAPSSVARLRRKSKAGSRRDGAKKARRRQLENAWCSPPTWARSKPSPQQLEFSAGRFRPMPSATLIERAVRDRCRASRSAPRTSTPPRVARTPAASPAEMLVDAGATMVIVGHSERREAQHESDDEVRAKAEAALGAGSPDDPVRRRIAARPRSGRRNFDRRKAARCLHSAGRRRRAGSQSPTSRSGRSGPGSRRDQSTTSAKCMRR